MVKKNPCFAIVVAFVPKRVFYPSLLTGGGTRKHVRSHGDRYGAVQVNLMVGKDHLLPAFAAVGGKACILVVSTIDGAAVIRQLAFVVFGKAMTSRILSVPARSMTKRSMPNAMPPWGGVPKLSASNRKPNFR